MIGVSIGAIIKRHVEYGRYVIRHKRFVYEAGRELGVGHIQLLLHDYHKLFPFEWNSYRRYFGSENWPLAENLPADYTGPTAESIKENFDRAWNQHQKRAPHHWQYWCFYNDDGKLKVLEMPDRYRREMLADWRGAGRALGKADTAGWYRATAAGRLLHPRTQMWVERELGVEPQTSLFGRTHALRELELVPPVTDAELETHMGLRI